MLRYLMSSKTFRYLTNFCGAVSEWDKIIDQLIAKYCAEQWMMLTLVFIGLLTKRKKSPTIKHTDRRF